MVILQIIRIKRKNLHPCQVYARRFNATKRQLSAVVVAKDLRPQMQATAWDLPKDFCPCLQDLIVDLGKVIQTAKGDVSLGKARRIPHLSRGIVPHITKVGFRKPQQLFRKILFIAPILQHGIKVAIRQEIIHCRKPCSIEISNAGKLHRRRLAGQHRQHVLGCMACQVKQYVYLIFIDNPGDLFKSQSPHIAPDIDPRGKFRAGPVLLTISVAINLKMLPVVLLQQSITEKSHHMEPQVRRNVAYTHLFSAVRFVAIGPGA